MLLLTEKIEKTYLVRNFLLTNLNDQYKLGAWPLVKTCACLLRFSALELWPSGWPSTQASCYAWGHMVPAVRLMGVSKQIAHLTVKVWEKAVQEPAFGTVFLPNLEHCLFVYITCCGVTSSP